jgi:hypothetical protein
VEVFKGKSKIILAGIIICGLAVLLAIMNQDGRHWHVAARPTNALKRIIFSTNGKITPDWLGQKLRIRKEANLFTLNIGQIKEFLENIPQVKMAFVEKRFPDTLCIRIEERIPLLRVCVNIHGKKKMLFVDAADGEFFSPVCYKKSDIANILPADLTLQADTHGPFSLLPIVGIETIGKFISTLKNNFPNIWEIVKFIDLRNYDSRPGAAWASINLHLKNGIVVVCGTQDFDNQLLRLDYLITRKCVNELQNIKKINLFPSNSALIERKYAP